jgi:hypothetical protein
MRFKGAGRVLRHAPKYLRDAQAEWLSIAEKQISA